MTILGTCLDCKTWTGPTGSAHDPIDCPHLDDAIDVLEELIEFNQARLKMLLTRTNERDTRRRQIR